MDRTPRLGRGGRGKRAGQQTRYTEDMNSYRQERHHAPTSHEVPRLGRGRGSSRGGRGRGRIRRPEPAYELNVPQQHIPPNYEIHTQQVLSEPQYYQQSARPTTPDLPADIRMGMEPTNLSYSSAPATIVQAGPAMRPNYAPRMTAPAHAISPRVSPLGHQATFVYSSYHPVRSPPSHMIQHNSPAAIPVLAPRTQQPLDPLPPQRQQIYSTEIPKTYQYASQPSYTTYNVQAAPHENQFNYNQIYENHSSVQSYNNPPPDNPYASSFSPDDYGGPAAQHSYCPEVPAGHTSDYNPYSDPAATAKRQQVCKFFNTMGCKYGEKCRFLHVKDDSIDVDFAICWDFNTFRGCSNKTCRWEHRACSKAKPHPYEENVECKPEYGLKHELREQEKKENLSDGSDIQEKSIPPEQSDGKEIESEI